MKYLPLRNPKTGYSWGSSPAVLGVRQIFLAIESVLEKQKQPMAPPVESRRRAWEKIIEAIPGIHPFYIIECSARIMSTHSSSGRRTQAIRFYVIAGVRSPQHSAPIF